MAVGPSRQGGPGLGDSSRGLQLRVAGAACALVAAGIHLALAFSDLIPGESTRGPAFALMGLGFAACAVAAAIENSIEVPPVRTRSPDSVIIAAVERSPDTSATITAIGMIQMTRSSVVTRSSVCGRSIVSRAG